MTTLRLVLGDQLSREVASLRDVADHDVVLLCEVMAEATYVRHHKQKIAFILSAMRHFAAELVETGVTVDYVRLDDADNTGSLGSEVARAVGRHGASRVIATLAGEHRLRLEMATWSEALGVHVEVREDDRFLCDRETFADWLAGRRQPRMEYFYREIRRHHAILMDGERPIGGKWNYDAENRKPPVSGLDVPDTYRTPPDAITGDVLRLVGARFADHFGDLEPFHYAVTRAQALEALRRFVEVRLPRFGDYQDAMLSAQPWMYHAHIGLYLNCGLLAPLECIRAAETAYHTGSAPLNAVEGFVRQIAGWREYVRGIYDARMPGYRTLNALEAKRPLPALYWGAPTRMNCLRQCVEDTRRHAYAHHIQRLMVLGNFALLCGVHPDAVNEWFLVVYADAYEWVELPNVTGMTLFADGGFLASKPYAASGAYINRMSDYCRRCEFSVREKLGANACPFNYLYWDFLARNRERLAGNGRMGMMYRNLDRMDEDQLRRIRAEAAGFLDALQSDNPP